jgi:phosphopantetheine adenylyltransferase
MMSHHSGSSSQKTTFLPYRKISLIHAAVKRLKGQDRAFNSLLVDYVRKRKGNAILRGLGMSDFDTNFNWPI